MPRRVPAARRAQTGSFFSGEDVTDLRRRPGQSGGHARDSACGGSCPGRGDFGAPLGLGAGSPLVVSRKRRASCIRYSGSRGRRFLLYDAAVPSILRMLRMSEASWSTAMMASDWKNSPRSLLPIGRSMP